MSSKFQNVHQDVISLPPAKEKFLKQLVELEIKKRIPDLKDFSFFYVNLREVPARGQEVDKRSSSLPVDQNGEIREIVDRLARHGKVALGDLFQCASPVHFLKVADGEPNEPVLGVLDVGTNKTMFLRGKDDFPLCVWPSPMARNQ